MRKNNKIIDKKIQLGFKVKKAVFALGSQTKNTICLLKNNTAYISNVHDNLQDPEDFALFEKDVQRFLKTNPQIIAGDLHSEYQSTKYMAAHKLIQHHHAHIAACMAENGLKNKKVIGVAFDGTGLGTDNTLWGAEFLIAGYKDFTRAAHLALVKLLGGEMAIREPWRLTAFWLNRVYKKEFLKLNLDFVKKINKDKLKIIQKMDELNLNAPQASSMGRLFDAVASLILAKHKVKFEAELAIELENVASDWFGVAPHQYSIVYSVKIKKDNNAYVIDPTDIFRGIVKDLISDVSQGEIAYRFHLTIAKMIKDMCLILRRENKINTVALSGGVFQNKLLHRLAVDLLYKEGFKILLHKELPPNDACISLGQAVIASYCHCEPEGRSNLYNVRLLRRASRSSQ